MKKYILVTGGAGFIGSYLVDGLIKKGHNVLIVDDLKGDSALFYINPKAEFIKKDATDPFLFQILDRYEIEGVYHLVAHTTTEGSFTNPHLSINTNSYSTWLIANYCRNRKIKRLIYSSTCAVYGDVSEDVINEKTPINPNSTYGSTKYAGELFIKQLLKNSESKYAIFRFTNIYGPGENLNFAEKGMIKLFSSYIWRKEPIIVKGSLERFRNFLFVEDIVEALIKAYDCENTYDQTYILSSGEKIYLKDLIPEIIKSSGNPPNYPVMVSEGTKGDFHGFHADASKAKRDLNWEPKYSLSDGLKKFFDWINKVPVLEDITKYHPFAIRDKESKLGF